MTMSEAHKGMAKLEKNTHGKNALAAPITRRGNAHGHTAFFQAVLEKTKHWLIALFDPIHGQQKRATAFSEAAYGKENLR